MTARSVRHFRKTVILYPICMLLIWLPSVFLGVVANHAGAVPAIASKLEARAQLAAPNASLTPDDRGRLRAQAAGDDVILRLVDGYAPVWLAALLGAAVMAAVMASDSQILALSTMFTEDIFAFYQGTARFGHAMQVLTGRIFVVVVTAVAYIIAMRIPAVDLRRRDAVCVRGLCRAHAAADRRAVLEEQHQMGRAREHSVDSGRRRRRRDDSDEDSRPSAWHSDRRVVDGRSRRSSRAAPPARSCSVCCRLCR